MSTLSLVVTNSAFVIDEHYPIAFDDCDSAEKILSWILHLSEKTWVTTDLLRRFIEQASARINLDVHSAKF